jgi:glycosyltransferase involved in cell wall biosynthesis
MIRVLHVIDHLELGGAQAALLDMLRLHDKASFEMEVAVMHGRGPFADALEALGIKVHSLAPAKWPPSYIAEFVRLLRNTNFQIVHFHLHGANWIAKPLAALVGQRVLIAHDHTSGDLRFRGARSLLPDASSHLFSSRIIAVSEGVRDFLQRWEAVSADLIELVPNGVDNEIFCPATEEQRREARRKLSLADNAFVAGSIGRLAPEKNLVMLAELAASHPDIVFAIAGSGPEHDRIASLASQLGVDSRLRLLGTLVERSSFYHALDLFIFPSLYEGLPMAILEAMSSAVPIIASRLEGIATVITDEKEGLLAQPGNVADFSRQLSRLRGAPRWAADLAQTARAKASNQFSAAVATRRIESIYRQELGVANVNVADRTSW